MRHFRTLHRRRKVVAMKRTAFTLASLTLITFLAACNNDPGKDKAKAQVAEAVTTQLNSAPAPGAETLKFSQDGSKVGWVGAKVTGKHDGGFSAFAGTITLVDKNPEKSQVSVDIDLGSVTSDQEKLTGHLKTADFLDTGKFPKAKFTSTGIKTGGENGATHTVTGNLQIRDVTKSITFPATIKVADTGVDVDADFAINRKDFGIAYTGKADDLIKDAVNIKLVVRAKK
jgi:polyisoprenoid-binding protein YceI